MKRQRWIGLTLCATALLGASACGDDDDEPSSTAAPSASAEGSSGASTAPGGSTSAPSGGTASPATDAPALEGSYKIMTIGPFSTGGAMASEPFDQILVGAQAAAKEINDAGGVNGRAIEIVECDSQGNSNLAVSCAQKAVDEDIPATVGVFDGAGDYIAPLEAAGIPVLGGTGLGPEMISPVGYPVYTGIMIYVGLFSVLADQGITDVGFVFQNREGVMAGLQPIIDAGTAMGLDITAIPVEQDQVDYSPIVARSQEHDSVIVGLLANQAISYITALRQAGYDGAVAGSIDPTTLEALGDDADGMYSSNAFLPATYTENEAVAGFVEAMDAIDPDEQKDDAAQNAYFSVKLFAALAEGLDEVTAQTLTERIAQIGPVETGLRPPVTLTEAVPSAAKAFPNLPRLIDVAVVFEQVEDGILVPINGGFNDAITGEPIPF